MPMIKNVVGLDLGSYSTKIVEIRQTLGGLEPVQAIESVNEGAQVIGAEDLADLIRENAFSLDQVTCALPGDRISLRRLEFPFRDRKRLNAAVPFEIESNIPFELDDVLNRLAGSRRRPIKGGGRCSDCSTFRCRAVARTDGPSRLPAQNSRS